MSVIYDTLNRLPVLLVTFMEPFNIKRDLGNLRRETDQAMRRLRTNRVFRILNFERAEPQQNDINQLLDLDVKARKNVRNYDITPIIVGDDAVIEWVKAYVRRNNLDRVQVFDSLDDAYFFVEQELKEDASRR